MNHYDGNYMHQGNDNELIKDISQAINGEYTAITCYGRLAEMAPSQEEKSRILEIRQDEMRHYQSFSNLYMSLTGRQPSPQLKEECPTEYIAGLDFSIKDEQEAVEFYHQISAQAQSPFIRELFMRASADEQNHAVWFLYYYTKHCCG